MRIGSFVICTIQKVMLCYICTSLHCLLRKIAKNGREGDSLEIGDAHDLTLPSNILVSMTIVGTRCSQIIRQKSSTELSVGPVIIIIIQLHVRLMIEHLLHTLTL